MNLIRMFGFYTKEQVEWAIKMSKRGGNVRANNGIVYLEESKTTLRDLYDHNDVDTWQSSK